ncbi:hypothetical protein G4G93_32200 [Methylobacterium sp. DB0501]|jgi:hypothetical protein|uniref:hypothetical protein n=1 Tax=Methylobacterium sp. DB0501 TaxID=2709665 RepID=UPI0013ECB135|nr:hypothetical protein [Methylobacterium sp. DB0501]NGM38506.1 hypothetical protein [Methylobacterium sp. DB0501]
MPLKACARVGRLSRPKIVGLAALALSHFAANVWACDASLPESGSVVEWPDKYLAAKVKVLKVWNASPLDRRASIQVLERIKGNLPNKFVVIYDTTSCGAFFAEGETQISGFVLLPKSEWKRNHRFESNSFVNTWVQAVFVDKKLILAQ